MSTKDLKAIMRRVIQAWNNGKAAAMTAIDETCATNGVFHSATGEDIHGLKDLKESMSKFYDAFPDVHHTIDDMIVEGDKIVVRFTYTGTHKGEIAGIPPTDKKVTVSGIDIFRFADDKRVEGWEKFDTLGLMQQLGVLPKPGKGE
jgi:steroid delta-isomerase-like uncharacterized protein